MRIITTLDEMIETARGWLTAGSVGYVPTAGNLNTDHLALVKAAQEECEICIVSIFVNPLQFASVEELARFPRPVEYDLQLLREAQVDVVFVPSVEAMYPSTFSTYITPTRPSSEHVDTGNTPPENLTYAYGFAILLLKLFQIIRPDFAYFRQEATPEVEIVQKLVQDLNIDITIRVLPSNFA
jgi:pantoate--beta-alanine ligase